jgi:hypothetical protein
MPSNVQSFQLIDDSAKRALPPIALQLCRRKSCASIGTLSNTPAQQIIALMTELEDQLSRRLPCLHAWPINPAAYREPPPCPPSTDSTDLCERRQQTQQRSLSAMFLGPAPGARSHEQIDTRLLWVARRIVMQRRARLGVCVMGRCGESDPKVAP